VKNIFEQMQISRGNRVEKVSLSASEPIGQSWLLRLRVSTRDNVREIHAEGWGWLPVAAIGAARGCSPSPVLRSFQHCWARSVYSYWEHHRSTTLARRTETALIAITG
jgi:hypothetical protein